jgi:hypothetical protein
MEHTFLKAKVSHACVSPQVRGSHEWMLVLRPLVFSREVSIGDLSYALLCGHLCDLTKKGVPAMQY